MKDGSRRVPSWTDRVLFSSLPDSHADLQCTQCVGLMPRKTRRFAPDGGPKRQRFGLLCRLNSAAPMWPSAVCPRYNHVPTVLGSDHRPVRARLVLRRM